MHLLHISSSLSPFFIFSLAFSFAIWSQIPISHPIVAPKEWISPPQHTIPNQSYISNLPNLTHLILFIILPSLMAILNPSATKRNRQGESRKSCLNSLKDLKKFNVDPLINFAKEILTHPIIHFTKWVKILCELRVGEATTNINIYLFYYTNKMIWLFLREKYILIIIV